VYVPQRCAVPRDVASRVYGAGREEVSEFAATITGNETLPSIAALFSSMGVPPQSAARKRRTTLKEAAVKLGYLSPEDFEDMVKSKKG
jgi:hypothetical protein